MTQASTLAFPEENLVGWERALYAFLVEKQRRSGSLRTVQGYSSMLQDFFGRVAKAPDKVTAQEVFLWAHGKGVSGKEPSPITIGARIGCLSSFFRFLQRMDIVVSNPCDKLERPRTSTPPARGLSADEVRRLLAIIPDTPQGLRDQAIILTLVLTGRRRAEVFRMTAGDLSFENGVCYYSYRGKGGKTGRRELPQPALDALRAALTAFGKELGNMGAFRVAVALPGGCGRCGPYKRHVLRPLPPLPAEGRAAACGASCHATHRGEAPSGCRGEC